MACFLRFSAFGFGAFDDVGRGFGEGLLAQFRQKIAVAHGRRVNGGFSPSRSTQNVYDSK